MNARRCASLSIQTGTPIQPKRSNMNCKLIPLACAAVLALAPSARAQLNIPSDASDGVFAPTASVEIDLSEASGGAWDADNSARAGRGIYDADKWAVVFKFASVSVPKDVTVTFKNHPSRAPVVWLVQGNVVIEGVVSLDGKDRSDDASLAHVNQEGGPGGFRGGLGNDQGNAGWGLGPVSGYLYNSYSSERLLPLIGGTGRRYGIRGPSGGGSILVATRQDIVVDGRLSAMGGAGGYPGNPVASGGGIRLVAQDVRGGGVFNVDYGRFRLEAITQHLTHPRFADSFPVNPGPTPVIWPPADAPRAHIVSVGGEPTPAEPLAQLNGQPDLTLQTTNVVEVVIETLNFPIEGSVQLRVMPKYAEPWSVGAAFTSGSFAQATWVATTTINPAYTTLQVRAAAP